MTYTRAQIVDILTIFQNGCTLAHQRIMRTIC